MVYEATYKSLKEHKVPEWFNDAKFGIFVHWGLYSVPAFAPKHTYAEWYLDNLRFKTYGGVTLKYHNETFGEDFNYDDFLPIFNEEIKKWNPDEIATLFKKIGVKYVVLVAKHHDGFLLWPSKYPNPKKDNYFASRDIVGELSGAVKKHGMIMGLYYSGVFDWTFKHVKVKTFAKDLIKRTMTKEYAKYVDSHWRELIDLYEPLILWNDIGMPDKMNLWELFAYFYNKFPEGIVNDRFSQIKRWMRILLRIPPFPWIFNRIAKKYQNAEKPPPEELLNFHSDFLTPEYKKFPNILEKKWEVTRGIGWSYGYNRFETEEDYISVKDLIHLFVDIVSKNGNLLLNVGPKADGSIPEIQKNRLLEFGKWLEINGDCIFGTRPWIKAEGKTSEELEVRFTTKKDNLYIIL
ncbi:MAG: alpha-L-fucosidase [Candidatus Thorarchaeota archaeon]